MGLTKVRGRKVPGCGTPGLTGLVLLMSLEGRVNLTGGMHLSGANSARLAASGWSFIVTRRRELVAMTAHLGMQGRFQNSGV